MIFIHWPKLNLRYSIAHESAAYTSRVMLLLLLLRWCLVIGVTLGNKDEDSLEWMQVQDDINKIKVPEYEVDLDARIKASEQG